MSAEANQQNAKITVHWLNDSRGQRIIWLLEELNLQYDIKTYKRGKDKRAPASLKEIHPLGKSPTITIEAPGLDKPLVLTESGAIVEYLIDYFGKKLVPQRYPEGKDGVIGAETEEWIRYRHLMHFAEGTLMPVYFTAMVAGNIRNAPVPFFLKFITNKVADGIETGFTNVEIKTNLTWLEKFLANAPKDEGFLCGPNLTGADCMMIFVLEGGVQHKSLNESSYPRVYNYVRRIQGRDAYKRAGDRVSEASGEKYVPFSEVKF